MMNTRRLMTFLCLMTASAAGAEDFSNRVCAFQLSACDFERDSEGTCPVGESASAQLFAEGEFWGLTLTGTHRGPGESTPGAERVVELGNLGATSDEGWTRAFFIVDETTEGGLTIAADGLAELDLWVFNGNSRYQEYYNGTCTPR